MKVKLTYGNGATSSVMRQQQEQQEIFNEHKRQYTRVYNDITTRINELRSMENTNNISNLAIQQLNGFASRNRFINNILRRNSQYSLSSVNDIYEDLIKEMIDFVNSELLFTPTTANYENVPVAEARIAEGTGIKRGRKKKNKF